MNNIEGVPKHQDQIRNESNASQNSAVWKKKIFYTLSKPKTDNLNISNTRQRIKLRKNMFIVKKQIKEAKEVYNSNAIFEVKKVPKSQRSRETKLKIKNFTEKYEKLVSIDELKSNLQFKIKNRKVIDPSEIKQIFKIQLLNKYGVYLTPDTSEANNSDMDEEGKEKKKERKMEMKYIFQSTEKNFNCSCRKSQCNKNYCACRNNNEICNNCCTCEDCQNSNIK